MALSCCLSGDLELNSLGSSFAGTRCLGQRKGFWGFMVDGYSVDSGGGGGGGGGVFERLEVWMR